MKLLTKKISILSIIIFITTINVKSQNIGINIIDNQNKYELPKITSKTFDKILSNDWGAICTFSKNNKFFLAVCDENACEINILDYYSGRKTSTWKLDTNSFKKGEYVNNILVNNDTIFIMQERSILMYKVQNDRSVKLIKSFNKNIISKNSFLSSNVLYSDNKFPMQLYPDKSIGFNIFTLDVLDHQQQFYVNPIEIKWYYDEEDLVLKQMPVYYSDLYKNKYFGLYNLPGRCYNENKNISVYNFPCDNNILKYDYKTNKGQYFAVKSNNEFQEPYSIDTTSGIREKERIKHYMKSSVYSQLLYDKYRKVYYRFYVNGFGKAIQNSQNNKSIADLKKKQQTIMILDDNLQLIKEIGLPDLRYNEYYSFVSPEGLCMYNYKLNQASQTLTQGIYYYDVLDVSSLLPQKRSYEVAEELKVKYFSDLEQLTFKENNNVDESSVLTIYDISGRLVDIIKYYQGLVVDFSGYESGMYIVSLSDHNKTLSKKIIKE